MSVFIREQKDGLLRDLEGMFRHDLEACITGEANYVVALFLGVLTEVLGGFCQGDLSQGHGNENYRYGIEMLGEPYREILHRLDRTHRSRGFLYGVLRSIFVHTLPFFKWVDGMPWPVEVRNDPKGGLWASKPCGLEIRGTKITVYTNTYAAHLMSAMKKHFDKIRAGEPEPNERLEQAILSLRQDKRGQA